MLPHIPPDVSLAGKMQNGNVQKHVPPRSAADSPCHGANVAYYFQSAREKARPSSRFRSCDEAEVSGQRWTEKMRQNNYGATVHFPLRPARSFDLICNHKFV
jgi:hypothetical protein